jgi:3-oxoacyl-[acyl-carrier-protein] synthase III
VISEDVVEPMSAQFFTGLGVAITGSGSATPETCLDNHALSQIVDTSDEWISTRTGIRQRRLSGAQGSLNEIAAQAAQNALEMAGVSPQEVDLIILTAACSGFVFGLVTAAQFIRTGAYQTIVLIGADVLSRWVDWEDRRTCVLFGDGAGAVVIQANARDRLLGFELRSDGSQNASLTLAYQGQAHPLLENLAIAQGTFSPIGMNGQEVYRFAARQVPEVIEKALFRANLSIEQVDWLLLHQANQRILDAVAQRLKIPGEKVLSNLANYGNTSAASIPLALDEAVRQGKVQANQILASSGFGAGLSWGAAIFQWGR